MIIRITNVNDNKLLALRHLGCAIEIFHNPDCNRVLIDTENGITFTHLAELDTIKIYRVKGGRGYTPVILKNSDFWEINIV